MQRTIPVSAYLLLLLGLAAANVSIYKEVLAQPQLQVQVIGTGKGHTVLVYSPQGKTLLIDAGPDAGILRALGKTLPMWKREIDAVLLTSSEAGSAGGLQDLRSRYRVADPIRFGTKKPDGAAPLPYGAAVRFDGDIRISVIAPYAVDISYGAARFSISSTTPPGIYHSDGNSIQE